MSFNGLSTEKIFADSKILTYYYFGFVIPFVETRFLVRFMEYLSTKFNTTLAKFNFKLALIYIFIAGGFVWLHSSVKGVDDNVALLMTFVFAIITFEFF